LFDWNIEPTEIAKASQSCNTIKARKAIHANIQNHFLICFATFLEWRKDVPLTIKIVNEGIENGVIDV
jgi:hypothetical protein